MTDYSFVVDVDVRFRDLDTMGHVNNAIYPTYMEEARVAYAQQVMDVSLQEVSTVIANLELEYRRPLEFHDDVSVAIRVSELGRSSARMEYEVRAGEEVAAFGETLQVVVDEESGKPKELPEDWEEKIREFEGLYDDQ